MCRLTFFYTHVLYYCMGPLWDLNYLIDNNICIIEVIEYDTCVIDI